MVYHVPNMRGRASGGQTEWVELAGRLRNCDDSALEALYALLSKSKHTLSFRMLSAESTDDRLHEILVIVIEAIRSGKLRNPERLAAFVKTVSRRRTVEHIRRAVLQRRHFAAFDHTEPLAPGDESPEARTAQLERVESVLKAVQRLRPRDREILSRFYLREQPPEQICREMGITGTQFRLHKSRALAKCLELAQRHSTRPFKMA